MTQSVARNSLAMLLEADQLWFGGRISPTRRMIIRLSCSTSPGLRGVRVVHELMQTPPITLVATKWPYNPHRYSVTDRDRNPRFPPLVV